MKYRTLLIVFTICGLVCSAEAKGKKRKPATAGAGTMTLTVVHGDKISKYWTEKKNKNFVLHFSNNQGLEKSASVSEKNMSYLRAKTTGLVQKPNDKGPCDRSAMFLEVSEGARPKAVSACLFSGSELATGLRSLTEVLTAALW